MAPATRRNNGLVRRPTVRQPIPENTLVELSSQHNKACMFCGRKEIDEKLYGLLYQLNDIVVHYFCILLSSNAVQNGADRDGIWGFLLKDIKAELARGARISCFYCGKTGATIKCCSNKCFKTFHLPCGLQNGSMHQYYKQFQSFCKQHRVIQTVDIKELQSSTPVQCAICKEDVVPTPLPSSIWAPCCKRNAWFHRECIQQLALSAGYFFKCPLCNNNDLFKSRMLYLGIYIPSRDILKKSFRDASWETVPNAYAELLERHNTCNASTCLCPFEDQRTYNQNTGSWEIILCHTCGSKGTHKLCSSLKCDQIWNCDSCTDIAIQKMSNKRLRLDVTTSTVSASVSNINVSSSQNNVFTRSNNTTDLVRNVAPRPTLKRAKILNDNPIVISDDSNNESDNDSDVLCITYVEPPKTDRVSPPIRISRVYTTVPNLALCSATTPSTSGVNPNHRRLARLRSNRFNNLKPSESIDLTSDDDNA